MATVVVSAAMVTPHTKERPVRSVGQWRKPVLVSLGDGARARSNASGYYNDQGFESSNTDQPTQPSG